MRSEFWVNISTQAQQILELSITKHINEQEDPNGPGLFTFEIGSKVTVEPFSYQEAQFENKW